MGASLICRAELGVPGNEASLETDEARVSGVHGATGVLAAFCSPREAGSAAEHIHQVRGMQTGYRLHRAIDRHVVKFSSTS